MIRKKNFLETALDYFLAIMLVLNCQSVYQKAVDKNYYIFELTLLAIVLSAICKFIKYGMNVKNLEITVIVSFIYVLLCSIVIFTSVSSDQFISFASRYLIFPVIMIYFFAQKNNESRRKIFIYYANVVCVIAVISIFFWFFGTLLHIINPTGTFRFDFGLPDRHYASYYDLYFEVQWVDWFGPSTDLKRNTSMFVEGPCYAIVLMFTLLFMYIFRKDVRKFKLKMVIIAITIITTFSVTAYAFLMAILFWILRKNKKIKYLIYFAGIPIALGAMIFIFIKKMGTGSYELRSGDTEIIINAWLMSPLYGNGYGDLLGIAEEVSNRDNLAVASSLGAILMQGGIIFLSMYIIPVIKGIVDGINKRIFDIILISLSYLAFLLVVLFQTFYINFFVWFLLLFYSYFEYSSVESVKYTILKFIRK